MSYCIYLRKSRKDIEAEKHGEGETLARHESMLLKLAKSMNLCIGETYKEIVSGESIAARPEMIRLLNDVESGKWDGVLVVEVERLARGDTMDQGIVAKAFSASKTKIITPVKTYDPENEFDEEYFEFGLFMSRREYKTINRRIQRGRIASVNEGKFIGSRPPYGYKKIKIENEKGYMLVPDSDTAPAVQLAFNMYANGSGCQLIAKELNRLGYKSGNGNDWEPQYLRVILMNPVYAGYIRWGFRKERKTSGGKTVIELDDNCHLVKGLHEPLISEDLFDAAMRIRKNGQIARKRSGTILSNPLAGLIICGECGKTMQRHKRRSKRKNGSVDVVVLQCHTMECPTVGSSFEMVEKAVLESLQDLIGRVKADCNTSAPTDTEPPEISALQSLKKEKKLLTDQITKTYDLLERGVYTDAVFKERHANINERLKEIDSSMAGLEKSLEERKKSITVAEFIPKVQNVLDSYGTASVEDKNKLLKSVLTKAIYRKSKRGKKNGIDADSFELEIYPVMGIHEL